MKLWNCFACPSKTVDCEEIEPHQECNGTPEDELLSYERARLHKNKSNSQTLGLEESEESTVLERLSKITNGELSYGVFWPEK